MKEKEELEKELKELRNEINDLDDEIAKMEGAPEEMEDIRKEAENFIKDKKKRPRPSYGKDFNLEQEERTEKRQKRNEVLQENIEERRNFEEPEQEILEDTQETGENMDNIIERENTEKEINELSGELEGEWNNEQMKYRESNRKRQSRKEIENLLEELSEKDLEKLEYKENIEEKITEEISEAYDKLRKQEGFLLNGKRKMMEIYYEFGKKFEEKVNNLIDNEQNEEMSAVSKIIKEIMKGGVNDNKRNIRRRSEKARKIYRIISVDGGKEKIKRLKVLNSEEYTKFSFKEIEEWIKNC